MSDETYRPTDDNDEGDTHESPAVTLGVPDKQPRDLGVHKVVFGSKDIKPLKEPIDAVLIVQDEYGEGENQEQRQGGVRTRLVGASAICIVFIALEFTGGFLSNSLVIAADAAQLLTVFSTMMVSLLTLELQDQNRRSVQMGIYRYEVMGALVSVLTTWVLTSIVLYLAVDRLAHGNFVLNVDMMLATSAFGVVANLLMGMTLHNNCHVQECKASSPTSVNVNVRSAFLHIVFDFLFSLAVFITALFIDCCPDWFIIDPISTLVFSLIVLYITLPIMKDLLHVLIEGVPKGIYFNDVLQTLLSVEGVQQVQDLKVWPLGMDKIALSVHLTIGPRVEPNRLLKIASQRIRAKYNFCELTIHVEALHDGPDIPK